MYKLLRLNRLGALWGLSRRAYGDYKKHLTALVLLGLAGGILEGIGINALIPLFSFALGAETGGSDRITRFIEKFFEIAGISFDIKYLLIFIAVLFVVRAFVLVLFEYLRVFVSSDYEKKSRKKVFAAVMNADWPYLIQQKLGYLENIIMIDVPYAGKLLGHISSAIMKLSGLLIYIIVAVNISLSITLITLGLGGLIFLFLKPFLSRIKKVARDRTQLNKTTSHHINENIFGVKTVKSMMVAAGVKQKAEDLFETLRGLTVRTSLLKGLNIIFIEPIGVIFIVILFGYMYQSGNFGIAQFVPIVYLIQKIFIYVQQLQTGLHGMNDGIPHLQSVLSYQQEAGRYKEISSGTKDFVFEKKLEFKDIHFSYSGKDEDWVLKKINFSISKGEMVGLIGPSGAGKTTIVDLALRLLRPSSGQICLDDMPADEIDLQQWREKIGYVSQDIFLINDTIRNNIAFYRKGMSDGEILEAAKMANIYDFIKEKPKGLDTVIGERGTRLSAGQRQRIVIARVLARKPEFLILDEATSALDNESEAQIQKVIHNLKGKVTVLAIAHRLSTVMDSDKLLVLADGRIVEEGPPEELLKDKESYFSRAYNVRK